MLDGAVNQEQRYMPEAVERPNDKARYERIVPNLKSRQEKSTSPELLAETRKNDQYEHHGYDPDDWAELRPVDGWAADCGGRGEGGRSHDRGVEKRCYPPANANAPDESPA